MRSLKPFFDFEGRERKWVPSGGGAEMGRLASIAIYKIALSEPCKGEFAILRDNRRRSQTPILASLLADTTFLSRTLMTEKNRAPSRTLLHSLNNLKSGKFLSLLLLQSIGNILGQSLKLRNRNILQRIRSLLRLLNIASQSNR